LITGIRALLACFPAMCEMKGCEVIKYNMLRESKLIRLHPDQRNILTSVFRLYF
jgi:hypothetical protein